MEKQTKQQEKSQGSDTSCSRFSQVTFNTDWGSSNKQYAIKHRSTPYFVGVFLFFSKSFLHQTFSTTWLHFWPDTSILKTSSRLKKTLFFTEATKPLYD